jgi:predicted patatin/cPLA2 family phospholipase
MEKDIQKLEDFFHQGRADTERSIAALQDFLNVKEKL